MAQAEKADDRSISERRCFPYRDKTVRPLARPSLDRIYAGNLRSKAEQEIGFRCPEAAWARRKAACRPPRRRLWPKNSNFLKCRPPKSLDKEKPIDMNLVADPPISKTGDFTSELALFPPSFKFENRREQTPSRLTRDQMDAFLAASDNARSAHFFPPPPEPPAATPEKGLAAGVLKQA